jgi:hypothetical protein
VLTARSLVLPRTTFKVAQAQFVILLPLKNRSFQLGKQDFCGVLPPMAPFSLYLQHQGVLITPLRMLHYSRAAARCNNRTLVASDPWILGTCRLRYLLELLLALATLTSPAARAIPLSSLLSQVRKQRECLLASYSEATIEIETQYQDLVSVYQKEQTLKACLDNCSDCSKFSDVWHLLGESSRSARLRWRPCHRVSKHSRR